MKITEFHSKQLFSLCSWFESQWTTGISKPGCYWFSNFHKACVKDNISITGPPHGHLKYHPRSSRLTRKAVHDTIWLNILPSSLLTHRFHSSITKSDLYKNDHKARDWIHHPKPMISDLKENSCLASDAIPHWWGRQQKAPWLGRRLGDTDSSCHILKSTFF